MPRAGRALVLSGCALAALATPAAAHRLKVFAASVGASIEGRAYFVGGGAAAGVAVRLRDAAGNVLAEGRTGGDGRFALATTATADLEVVADAMDGHVARFAIPASRLPAAAARPNAAPEGLQASAAVDEIEAAVARQVAPLAERLDEMESAIRLRDVVGGLGYVAGIFGLLALLKARRRARGTSAP